LVVPAVHVAWVAHVVEDKEKVDGGQRLCILAVESYRSELLQAAEDMVVEDAFVADRNQDQEYGQVAADDVCRYLDDHIDLQLVGVRKEPLAYHQEPRRLDRHSELRRLRLQAHQSAL
jgi:hypothetical protein